MRGSRLMDIDEVSDDIPLPNLNNGVNAMDSGGRQQRGEELAMEPRTRESRETSSDPIAERNGTILQARRLLSLPAGGANL